MVPGVITLCLEWLSNRYSLRGKTRHKLLKSKAIYSKLAGRLAGKLAGWQAGKLAGKLAGKSIN